MIFMGRFGNHRDLLDNSKERVSAVTHVRAGKGVSGRSAFTLVELLVVITIIGILVGLLMPAIQSARESGRATQCINNIKQLAIGCTQHVEKQGYLPSDGWGYKWIGDPDHGFGRKQPGGWNFSILPFIEQENVWSLGLNKSGTEKTEAFRTLLTTPIAWFFCPSRRKSGLYEQRPSWSYSHPDDPGYITHVVKSDYAINRGTVDKSGSYNPGPGSESAFEGYNFPNSSTCTGLAWWATEYRMAAIRDGSSNTILVGEKGIRIDMLQNWEAGDPQNAYIGHDPDNSRLIGPEYPLSLDSRLVGTGGNAFGFGGPHPGGWQCAFADGSVHSITWTVDLEICRRLGDRNDGEVIRADSF